MLGCETIITRIRFGIIYLLVLSLSLISALFISEYIRLYSDNKSISIRKVPVILGHSPDVMDTSVSFTVQSGDTLSNILHNAGLSNKEAFDIITALKKHYNPSKISIGQNISVFYDDGNREQVSAVKLSISPEVSIEIIRTDNGFEGKEVLVPLTKHYVHVSGKIEGSLFATAANSNIPKVIVQELVNAFSYDVDFQRNIHDGDSFDIVYERYYDDQGNFVREGKVNYMSLTLSGKTHKLFYFESKNGGEYFTENGTSVKKQLLKTPINAARISSGFGMRKHPILGYSKMHKGVDFAAPVGTPIYAAGNGTIEEIGRKGAYGNYIKIKHNSTLSTAYAHCSKFKKGLKKGSRVKQGEVIAFVGTTGRSTGPHLHFEVLQNNKHVNPLKVKQASSYAMTESELKEFKSYVNRLNRKLISMPSHTEILADSIRDL